MSVIALRGRDPESEARALLNCVLRDGDIVGTDSAGRTALLLVLDPWTLDRLLAFDADATDLEDNGDLEDDDGEPESRSGRSGWTPPIETLVREWVRASSRRGHGTA